MRNAPLLSLVPVTAPGLTVTAWFGAAPDPSTRNCVPDRSERVIVTAADASVANAARVAITTTTMPTNREYRIHTPTPH